MKRTAGTLVLLSALSGCTTMDSGPSGLPACNHGPRLAGPSVPGVCGARGEPVAMIAPYSAFPQDAVSARRMMAASVPLNLVQPAMPAPSGVVQASHNYAGLDSGVMQAQATAPPGGSPPQMMLPRHAISPPGIPAGPGLPMPGQMPQAGGIMQASNPMPPPPPPHPGKRTSIRFGGPAGMKVAWFTMGPDGRPAFSRTPIEAPGRYNFTQAAIYRLKLTDIPNRPGLELYPTLEVVPSNSKTDAFLAHSAVPVTFTEEDFEQVASGNYLVKVVYLPDPQYQDLATTGPNEVVSSRLEPGVDPIAEACRRGSILLVIRMGNIDLEAPNTPAMDAPNPFQMKPPPHAGAMPPGGGMPPGQMMMMGPNGPIMPGMRPGAPMMGPNGPMMGPNGPMMGVPPANPTMLPPPSTGAPVTQPVKPDTTGKVDAKSGVQQVKHQEKAKNVPMKTDKKAGSVEKPSALMRIWGMITGN